MRVVEEGTRWWGTQCGHDRIGRCQEWEQEEQEEVGRGQPEVEIAERAGPGYLGLAGSCLAQHDFLCNDNLLIDHHPVVVQRVAHLAHA